MYYADGKVEKIPGAMMLSRTELNNYRRQAITAAKELGYGKAVVERLMAAENDAQITNIMKSARTSRR